MPEPICYKELLQRHGFSFSKGLGQNFLTSPAVPARIAEGCGADGDTFVLEVGPGAGILTRELGLRAGNVVSLEIDERLLPVLDESLRDFPNCQVILSDVLKADIAHIVATHAAGRRAVACANLPYYITSPALSRLIDAGCFDSITVMVQKEVARRLCAAPDTEDFGAFSLYVQYHGAPRILFDVPAGCFTPKPKVDSAVLRIDLYKTPPVACHSEEWLFRTVRAGFSMRRKTLRNCLASGFGSLLSKEQIAGAAAAAGIDLSRRGESLSLQEYAALSNTLYMANTQKGA